MKKIAIWMGCLALVLALSGVGLSGEMKGEMEGKMKGNLMGEVVKIDGEMVDVKTSDGNVRAIHIDPKTTKKTGKIEKGAMVEADVTGMGHAKWITVKEKMD